MNSNSLWQLGQLYADRKGYKLSTVSRHASGSGDTLKHLQTGSTITTRRYGQVLQWFSDHWPEDLDWPDDVPRPPANASSDS